MKLPQKVQICGRSYTVRRLSTEWGGNCATGSQTIGIGTARNQSAGRVCANFIHEVLECAAMEQKLRYESSDSEIMFVMTHKQFDSYANDVSTALFPLLR